jgi:hypothetical protein
MIAVFNNSTSGMITAPLKCQFRSQESASSCTRRGLIFAALLAKEIRPSQTSASYFYWTQKESAPWALHKLLYASISGVLAQI